MQKYLAGRFLGLIPVMFGVTFLVFFILNLAPGDVTSALLDDDATVIEIEELREQLGLNQPFPIRYAAWMGSVLTGDFGKSALTQRAIGPQLFERFKASLVLTVAALVLSTILGVGAGIVSATRQYSLLDKLVTVSSLFGVSMPNFWLGLVLIIAFSLALGWLPSSGMLSSSGDRDLWDLARHLVLPAITLAIPSMGIVARLTRSAMLEVLRQDYVRTARAKGLHGVRVVMRHALKNAMIPVVTVIGIQVGNLLSGTVLVETVFSWPGLGTYLIAGVASRDLAIVQGVVLIIAVIFVFVNLVVDVLYGYLDPRIRYT